MEPELQRDERPVSITILGGSDPSATAPAQITGTSGRRMTISTELSPEPGAAVQIRTHDCIILADVLTKQSVEGTLVVHIRHILHTDAIAYIRQQWE